MPPILRGRRFLLPLELLGVSVDSAWKKGGRGQGPALILGVVWDFLSGFIKQLFVRGDAAAAYHYGVFEIVRQAAGKDKGAVNIG